MSSERYVCRVRVCVYIIYVIVGQWLYTLELQDEEIILRGAVVAFCGDTPASCYIGGFKEGVGFSLRKCRRCMVTLVDMTANVRIETGTIIILS